MVQGRGVDAPLNETGRQQALRVYTRLNSVPFDMVYTSALQRSQQTVDPFVKASIPHFIHDGFDEISWGDQEGVMANPEAKNLYAKTIDGWRRGELNLNVGGGESPLQVMERQQHAMEEVLEKDGANMLICMHGRAIRILLCWLLGYPLNYMDGFPHRNCAYYKLILRGDAFFMDQFNETAHLDD